MIQVRAELGWFRVCRTGRYNAPNNRVNWIYRGSGCFGAAVVNQVTLSPHIRAFLHDPANAVTRNVLAAAYASARIGRPPVATRLSRRASAGRTTRLHLTSPRPNEFGRRSAGEPAPIRCQMSAHRLPLMSIFVSGHRLPWG